MESVLFIVYVSSVSHRRQVCSYFIPRPAIACCIFIKYEHLLGIARGSEPPSLLHLGAQVGEWIPLGERRGVEFDAQPRLVGQRKIAVLLYRISSIGRLLEQLVVGAFPFMDHEVPANRHRLE